jgi:hypothetical protein
MCYDKIEIGGGHFFPIRTETAAQAQAGFRTGRKKINRHSSALIFLSTLSVKNLARRLLCIWMAAENEDNGVSSVNFSLGQNTYILRAYDRRNIA